MQSCVRVVRVVRQLFVCLLIVLFAAPLAFAEPIPFRRAIELALQHSGVMAVAAVDRVRAYGLYNEARRSYAPAVVFGSGLGYSFGVPLTIAGSAPSLFNLNTQQYVVNFAQRDLVRAARIEWQASNLDIEDKRAAVILDTALLYTELDSLTEKLRVLREQLQAGQRAEFISIERRKEGIDSELDVKRAQLTTARAQLRLAEAEGNADVLRERLGKLVGIPAASLETVTDSVPRTPNVDQSDDLSLRAVQSSVAAKYADQKAQAADFRARSESRQLLPSVDFATQYALLSTYNNYDEFYRKFSRNNFSFGASIRFPLFNPAQRAHAEAAKADAIKAKRQAEDVRDQVANDTLKLQRSVKQLAAAREVARLEYELAQGNLDATQAKVQGGTATARDVESARADASDRHSAYLDATFELYRVQMQLMRATGDLQDWALGR
ncbi:MAG TPA: TolC family protein [Clostridia bacterium]|nr:TolC family protein [Clostridia bacterium]